MKNDLVAKPNFFVIGVVKGGTTSLYHYLIQHPNIYLPTIKETNHFASADINHTHFLKEYAMDVKIDLDAYIRGGMKEQVHIAHVDDPNHYQALFNPVRSEKAIGEISNSYMIARGAAEAIHSYNSKAKILVILRNPVNRAWSQYLMNLREAKSSEEGFITSMTIDEAKNPKGWGVNHQYLELGEYSTQLKRYVDLFGKESVKTIFYEHYRKEPREVMKEICSFLEVDETFDFDFTAESNSASLPRNAILNKLLVKSGAIKFAKGITPKNLRKHLGKALYSDKNLPVMSQEERSWMIGYYQREVNELAQLIGAEVYEYWPDFKTNK